MTGKRREVRLNAELYGPNSIWALRCVYGGPTTPSSYWMIADGCPLYHGEGSDG